VEERRRELGLTADELASRAGMSPGYLHYVESSPSAELPRAALWRLAASLETSVDDLSGSGMEAAPGRTVPSDRPVLEPLMLDECRSLIATGGVGRLVFSDATGPKALPVNFRMLGGDIVFRTDPKAPYLVGSASESVAFEVDHLDEALTEGWSVLVSGHCRPIVDQAEIHLAQSLDIVPWAGGDRGTYVRLVPSEMTGRRIRRRQVDG
jgi:transcriptional regulator with XRE-family HTH domain